MACIEYGKMAQKSKEKKRNIRCQIMPSVKEKKDNL